jgi:hypothetical protein
VGDPDLCVIDIALYHVINGTPAEQIQLNTFNISMAPGWQTFNFSYPWSGGSETEFLIAVVPELFQIGIQVGVTYLWMDPEINPPNRNWKKPTFGGSWELCTTGGDFMIRTEICCVGVDSSTLGMIRSLYR